MATAQTLISRHVASGDALSLLAAVRAGCNRPTLAPGALRLCVLSDASKAEGRDEAMPNVVRVKLAEDGEPVDGVSIEKVDGALALCFKSPDLDKGWLNMQPEVSLDDGRWCLPVSYMAADLDPSDVLLSGLPDEIRLEPEQHAEVADTDKPREFDGVVHFDSAGRSLYLIDHGRHIEFAQSMQGVEILRVGRWNGVTFSLADLRYLAEVQPTLGYRPVVKLGHESSGANPAMGYVTNLRVQGDRLLADFENVPDDLVKAISEGRYHSVSSEVFFDLRRDGKKYRLALKAVAVLGATIPAVDGLRPLGEALVGLADRQAVLLEQREEVQMADNEQTTDTAAELAAARAQIADLTAKLEQQTGDDSAIEIRRLNERLAEAETQLAQTAEAARMDKARQLAAKCLHAGHRPHIMALADLATRGKREERLVKFSADGETARDTDALAIIEDHIDRLNKQTELLLGEAALTGDFDRDSDAPNGSPDEQLYALITAYAHKHQVDFSEARRVVMSDRANARLVRAYNGTAI